MTEEYQKIGLHYDILREVLKEKEIIVDAKDILPEVQLKENQRVVDDYWVIDLFAHTLIVEDSETFRLSYRIVEPELTKDESLLLSSIFSDLRRVLILRDFSVDLPSKVDVLLANLDHILEEYAIEVSNRLYTKMLYYLFREFFGYSVIDPFVNDTYIEDISCDGYDIPIYVYHMKYGNLETNVSLPKEAVDKLTLKLAQKSGKYLSIANPLLDATLPDGSRLQATFGTEITPRGSSFTIRKFTAEPLTPIDLIYFGTIPSEIMAYLWLAIEHKLSALIVGETASGKTTTLNSILMFVPPEAKIISIEDTREIKLYHNNWISGVTREGVGGEEIDMYDLLRAALRQRPDYIVVGEVRGREALTLFQAMSTGHAAYSTLHAGDINQMIYRLESEPLNIPRSMLQFLDIALVQFMWVKGGLRKRYTKEFNEVLGVDTVDKNLLVNQVYRWDPALGTHVQVAASKKIEKIAEAMGGDLEAVRAELNRRKLYLDAMKDKGIRSFKEVTKRIHAYYRNPDAAFKELVPEYVKV
ncbi:MAG: type II/IV secretion system ATPase subunit [Archaeoglobus sp.]|nr:type II/IV secretion system ATPase subunit [Archaeoglobus sp.]